MKKWLNQLIDKAKVTAGETLTLWRHAIAKRSDHQPHIRLQDETLRLAVAAWLDLIKRESLEEADLQRSDQCSLALQELQKLESLAHDKRLKLSQLSVPTMHLLKSEELLVFTLFREMDQESDIEPFLKIFLKEGLEGYHQKLCANGMSLLDHALVSRYDQLALKLVQMGADVNANSSGGWTAMHYAAWTESVTGVEFLLNHQANPNKSNDRGETPLHLAIRNSLSHEHLLKRLIDAGADLNAQNRLGQTPLHKASEMQDAFVVEFLLQHGASFGLQDSMGNTPLHLAAQIGALKSAQALVQKGANLDALNHLNQSPLEITLDQELMDYLKEVRLVKEEVISMESALKSISSPSHSKKSSLPKKSSPALNRPDPVHSSSAVSEGEDKAILAVEQPQPPEVKRSSRRI